MEYFYYIANALVLIGLSYFFYFKNKESKVIRFFWIGLFYKLAMTVFVGYYYALGDTWQMFNYTINMNGIYEQDSFSSYWRMIFLSEFKSDYWKLGTVYWGNPRAFFMMKIISLINILTDKNYWLTSFYISLFSYFGTFFLLINITKHYQRLKVISIFVLLFLPSVVFNASGIMKESLAFGSICFILGFAILVNIKAKTNNLWLSIGLLLSLVLLYKLKFYFLAVLVPTIFLYFLLNFIKQITPKKRFLALIMGLFILGGLIHSITHINPMINITSIFDTIATNSAISAQNSLEGSYIKFFSNDNSLLFFLQNIPKALVYGLFGPFIWESKNLPMLYIGLENLTLLIGFLILLVQLFKNNLKMSSLAWSFVFYILVLAIILPLASPNFGTLTRYKISYFPFLFILIFRNITFVNQKLSQFFNLFDFK